MLVRDCSVLLARSSMKASGWSGMSETVRARGSLLSSSQTTVKTESRKPSEKKAVKKAYEEAIRLDPKNLSAKKNLKSVGEKHAVNAMEPGKGVQCTIC